MYVDPVSVAIGLTGGAAAGAGLMLFLLRKALAAYHREQERAAADEKRRQDLELLERVNGMVRDILKVRAMPDPDDPHPLKTLDLAESNFIQMVKEADEAAARIERARHILNYKNGKG